MAQKKGARFGLAFAAAKLASGGLKLIGRKGGQVPGVIAEKIDPQFLAHLEKPAHVAFVTGTNGKTTTVNLIDDILSFNGRKFVDNRAGGNIITALESALINASTMGARMPYEDAVFELDELSSRRILPYVDADIILCTNLYRDSFMRNANPDYIFSVLTASISPKTELILNADDLISCRLAPQCEKRTYFSVSCALPEDNPAPTSVVCDLTACPECGGKLEYKVSHIRHVGHARCTSCGFTNPEPDYEVTSVDPAGCTFTVRENRTPGTPEYTLRIASYSVNNLYNLLAAYVMCRKLGLLPFQISLALEKGVDITRARYFDEEVAGKHIVNVSAKGENGTGVSMGFEKIRRAPGNKAVILGLADHFLRRDRYASEYIGWHYLAHFEMLTDPAIKQIIAIGPREKDFELRLLLAGVDPSIILTAQSNVEAADLVDFSKVDSVYIAVDVYNNDIADECYERLRERLEGRDA